MSIYGMWMPWIFFYNVIAFSICVCWLKGSKDGNVRQLCTDHGLSGEGLRTELISRLLIHRAFSSKWRGAVVEDQLVRKKDELPIHDS